jgi:hypothetical protein
MIMLSHENCNYFEQVVPYKNHEHAAKSFIRTDNLGYVGPNPEHGLGIEVDWDIVSRDWYSHIRLDEKVLNPKFAQSSFFNPSIKDHEISFDLN